MRGLVTAFRTLTSIPLPGRESRDPSDSLAWFAVVGLFLGMILWAIASLWRLMPFAPWPAGVALMMVGAEIWLTGGLHLDGLADWADSLGGLKQREKRLAIMKDARMGAFGTMALILAVAAKWMAFERLFSFSALIWVLPILAFSRGMLVELIVTLPYARKGEGTARAFVEGASTRDRWVSHLVCLCVSGFYGPFGFAALGMAWIIQRLFAARCRSQFGGITGDLLGTANELVETGLLILCALTGEVIMGSTGWAWIFR
ncbi:MAG: adenosylcobinamide-GDP ribazoletransferase [Deltaproteobacteria bacterium]|nr:adenosylcobinamide-GDP ribazoletransferase [Deltaproteobacteria bacterium]